jgi:hypothetical protein
MRSNAGMANRQGDVELREAQVSAPQLNLWLGLAWLDQAIIQLGRYFTCPRVDPVA